MVVSWGCVLWHVGACLLTAADIFPDIVKTRPGDLGVRRTDGTGTQPHGLLIARWLLIQELVDGQPLFPGESDVDQLYIIQRLLGAITTHQNAVFMKNPRFNGYKFGNNLATNPTTLEHRYRSKLVDGSLPAEGLDFMKQCLRCSLSLTAWTFCRTCTVVLPHAKLTSWRAGVLSKATALKLHCEELPQQHVHSDWQTLSGSAC